MREIITLIGLTLGKRKTRRAKILFVNTISKELMENGVKVQLYENKQAKHKNTNVLINENESKTIIATNYDTGSKMYIPNYKYYPLDIKRNYREEMINLFLHFLSIIPIIIVYFIFKNFNHVNLFMQIVYVLSALILLYVALLGIIMPSSPVNYSRNSISVSLIYKLALDKKVKASYVLCDNASSSYLGYQNMQDYFGSTINNKNVLILDSISNGENLYVCCSNKTKAYAADLAKKINGQLYVVEENNLCNTPLSLFPRTIMITTGTINKDNEIVVDNARSKRDYKIDVTRLEKLLNDIEKTIV